MKRFCMIALAIWLLCAPVLADNEIDMDYTGLLDTYSGAPATGNGSNMGTLVYISDSIDYDKDEKRFYYTVSGAGRSVSSTVMDGMVTTQPVSVTVADGLSVTLYRDGVADDQVLDNISAPGSYAVSAMSSSGNAVTLLHFTIVAQTTGKLELYRMPKGFYVTKLQFNGEEIDCDSSLVDFSQEGDYAVEYICYATGIPYSLEITVDHTPPVLTFSGVGEDGVARGPVKITDFGDASAVTTLLDGEVIRNKEQLTSIGHYELVAEDLAGNRANYEFTIMVYFNTTSIVFIAATIVLLIALAVYLIRFRTRMRVR